ncbi:MAG: hypothetical protein C4539_04695 [Ignavibacteriales bacterium]|nr:MAG: hypothetical protein C4539_04695 [Ignavibacteriales bacterium]
MMKPSVQKVLFILLLSLLSNFISAQNPELKITPLDKPAGEFGPIGFRITAPWMNGYIEMRYPETVDGDDGMYFIDHYRPDMLAHFKMEKYPDWTINQTGGEISYSYTTPEGIEFGGYVNPKSDEVNLEFFVKNHSDKIIKNISPQICLMLDKSDDFNKLKTTSDVFIWAGNKCIGLDKTTPTAANKGRDAQLVIPRKGFTNMQAVGKTKILGPGEDIGTWWRTNEESDEDIILRESRDKKHLVAVSWPGEVSFIIYNSLNPCIHAGPSIQFTIEPGRERHWYGIIYLMKNDPGELLKKYKNGKRNN